MKKAVQIISKEYLASTKGMTPDQVCDFLESFRIAVLGRSSGGGASFLFSG